MDVRRRSAQLHGMLCMHVAIGCSMGSRAQAAERAGVLGCEKKGDAWRLGVQRGQGSARTRDFNLVGRIRTFGGFLSGILFQCPVE